MTNGSGLSKRKNNFIKKAKELWGPNKYDYSESNYQNNTTKIKIVCTFSNHGFFHQTPSNHLHPSKKEGCKKCAREKRSKAHRDNKKDFIDKSVRLHGEFYDYSNVVYINQRTKVLIGCPLHGDFPQEPQVHLRGCGCDLCGTLRTSSALRKPVTLFIEESKVIHGNQYDYSKVDYKSSKDRIRIICKTHGEFKQLPSVHLNGGGCSRCRSEKKVHENIEKYEKIYTQRINYIHEDSIQILIFYVKVDKKNKRIRRIRALCKKHNELLDAQVHNLLKSRFASCKKCRSDYLKKTLAWTKGKFILEANRIHGEKYSYEKSDYINARTPIDVICPRHKVFTTRPDAHLRSSGCRECANEELKGVLRRTSYPAHMVYGIYLVRLNHLDGESFIKVGLTIDSVKKRFSHLANYKYKIISFIKTYYRDAWDAEDDLKTYFKIKGLKHWPKHPLAKSGRPFGRTECAKDSSKLVEYVKTRLSMLENLNNV